MSFLNQVFENVVTGKVGLTIFRGALRVVSILAFFVNRPVKSVDTCTGFYPFDIRGHLLGLLPISGRQEVLIVPGGFERSYARIHCFAEHPGQCVIGVANSDVEVVAGQQWLTVKQ
ncbi:hypothetical protein D3C81_1567690 [compost metagenome]